MVGLCPAFQPKLGVLFEGDGASLFHFAADLDEIAEAAGAPLLTSFTDEREPPPDFDGFPEDLGEALGPWTDWFSPTEGLRCVEALLRALEDDAVRTRLAGGTGAGVHDDLDALHAVLLVAKKKGARFRLELA